MGDRVIRCGAARMLGAPDASIKLGCHKLADHRGEHHDADHNVYWRAGRELYHEHSVAAHNGYCVDSGCDFDGWTPEERKRREAAGRKVQR